MTDTEIKILINVFGDAAEKLATVNKELEILSNTGKEVAQVGKEASGSANEMAESFSQFKVPKDLELAGIKTEKLKDGTMRVVEQYRKMKPAQEQTLGLFNNLIAVGKKFTQSVENISFGDLLKGGIINQFGETGSILLSMGSGITKYFSSIGKVFAKTFNFFRKTLQQLKRFNPAWLSLLFIAASLSRVFKGMINPILELFGVFDYLNTVILVVLLPVIEPLINMLYTLFDAFLNLPEDIQKVIGGLILFGGAILMVINVFSQFMLLIGSLGVGFGTLLMIIAPFAGVLGTVTAAFLIMGKDGEKTVENLVNRVVDLMGKMFDFLGTLIDKLVIFFNNNKGKILEMANRIMETLLNGLYNLIIKIDPFVTSFIKTLKTFFETHKDKLYEIAQKVMGWLIDFFIIFLPLLIDMGIKLLRALLQGLKDNKDKITPVVKEVIKFIGDAIITFLPDMIDMGITIALAIAKGIGSWFIQNPQFLLPIVTGFLIVLLSTAIGAVFGGPIGAAVGAVIGSKLGVTVAALEFAGLASTAKTLNTEVKTGTDNIIKLGNSAKSIDPVKKGFDNLSKSIVVTSDKVIDLTKKTDKFGDEVIKLENKSSKAGLKGLFSKIFGSFQTGGLVPETGPYLLHAGEYVVPKKEVSSNIAFQPIVTVYATGNGPVNGDEIARRVSETLNREWAIKFQRMARR
jgi:hypothetical protein